MASAVRGRVLIAMLVVLGLLHNAAATVYPVGGSGGWTYVTSGGKSYDDQFKSIHLVPGDVLSFVFVEGSHNVLEVPAADVSTCNTTSATQTFSSSVNITLTTTGSHGFICGFPTHCADSGMQLLVTVNAAATPVAAPGAAPVASPVTSPIASPKASPIVSPVAAPKSSSSSSPPAPPATPTPAPKGSSVASTTGAPGKNAASVLQTGPAMAMGALLAACAVLAF